jgi:hypothetical protein
MTSPNANPQELPTEGPWQSRTAGDVVLASTPPYKGSWGLAMGIPLVSALLEQVGITSRIVRFEHFPKNAPPEIIALREATMWGDDTVPERMSRIRAAARRNRPFFDLMLSRLLAGTERVFGFSVWRVNVDVTLELARQLKEHRPEALVILGGPEAGEVPEELELDWIDVVVKGGAEGVVVPVVTALLDGKPGDAGGWERAWVNPRHRPRQVLPPRHAESPPIPRMDYAAIVPLLVGAPFPSLPALMNIGCPFRCSFCTNTTIYPELEWGNPKRVVDEMVEATGVWKSLHPEGAAPPLEFMFSDAALDAQPAQFDELCERLISADWPLRPGSILSQFILDQRITPERAKLAMDAGMNHSFFGLESANPRIRRLMKKPGKKEDIAAALQACADVGWTDSMIVGIIVGWPDETEEEFFETMEFVDWIVTLGIMRGLNVVPMVREPGMMDKSLLREASGAWRGIAWHAATAAGSPKVRGRRLFHTFEHLDGLARVQSPLSLEVAVNLLLDGETPGFWDRWIARHPEDLIEPGLEQPPAAGPVQEKAGDDAGAEPTAEPELSALSEPGDDAGVEPKAEPEFSALSERTLVGRGASVVLRLHKDEPKAFAKWREHGLTHTDCPAALWEVVHQIRHAFGELPGAATSTEDVWIEVSQIVAKIAPDVCLD